VCSPSTCCACAGAVLRRLANCWPVPDGSDGILCKVISTLSGEEAVRSPSVRGDRTSPFTVGVNRAVCGV
jgi:hypothetical protein